MTELGLLLFHGIVQKHVGEIEVESTSGAETTMRIWLPERHNGVDLRIAA